MHTYNTYMNVCCCAYVDAVSCVHAALPESLFTFKLYNYIYPSLQDGTGDLVKAGQLATAS
jgi:hypothetical protein